MKFIASDHTDPYHKKREILEKQPY